jgi:hemerythrin superfamily protein
LTADSYRRKRAAPVTWLPASQMMSAVCCWRRQPAGPLFNRHPRTRDMWQRTNPNRKARKELKEDGSSEDKSAIVEQICNTVVIHAQLEEELFYPAVRKAIDDADLMDEALVEHAGAKDLIEQLQGMDADDDLYDAKVTVLGEQIDHHVEKEEGDMFPQAKKAKVDTVELGATMRKRKAALLQKMGISDDESDTRGAQDTDEDDEEDAKPKKKVANRR